MTVRMPDPSLLKAWLDFVSSLVWPTVILIILVAFKAQIEGLLKRIKSGELGGAKFDFQSLPEPPSALSADKLGAAVSDATSVAPASESAIHQIDAKYAALLEEDYFLLHATEIVHAPTSPGTGFFRVRVWLEAISDGKLKRIESVTYRVWHDFPKTRLATKNRSKQFDVWLNVNGEFPILACIKLADGKIVWRSRYLDLPGRPKDADDDA
ncbi:MAG TPA: pYEATS domain-containing protein [Chthoniobacterales bacterium]|nr:pYEATS domain-containing protein [Chthoniobacterales bacterium]